MGKVCVIVLFQHVIFSAYKPKDIALMWAHNGLVCAAAAPALQLVLSEERSAKEGKAEFHFRT